MKLPHKTDQASRSMASAFRNPILRDNVKQEVAATQRHVSMPTNYDDVGRAQANAALAQGKVGVALADAGIGVMDAGLQINYANQKADYLSKTTELENFVSEFYASAAMDQTLTEQNEGGKGFRYENLRKTADDAFRKESERLNKKYNLTVPEFKDKFSAFKSGQSSAFGIKMDDLARGAHMERIEADGDRQFTAIKDQDGLDSWIESFGTYLTPADRQSKRIEGEQNIKSYNVSGTIKSSVSGTELRDIYSQIGHMENDRLVSPSHARNLRSQVTEQMRMLETDYIHKMSRANTHDQVNELAEITSQNELFADASKVDKSARIAHSRITTGQIEALLVNQNGEITDNVDAILQARQLATNSLTLDQIEPADNKRIRDLTFKAAMGSAKEELMALWKNDPLGRAAAINDRFLEITDGTANPNDYGFEADDPDWGLFKDSLSQEINRLQNAYNKTIDTAAKEDNYMASAMTVADGDHITAMGFDGKDYEEVMERVWQIKNSGVDASGFTAKDGASNSETDVIGFVGKYRYVPKAVRTTIEQQYASSDPMVQRGAIEVARAMGRESAWNIEGEPFDSAESLERKLAGINLGTVDAPNVEAIELQKQIVNDHIMSDTRGHLGDTLEATVKGSLSTFSDDFKTFYDAGNAPNNWGKTTDDVAGFERVTAVAQIAYEDALRAGRDPSDAMAMAMRVVSRKVGQEKNAAGEMEYVANSLETAYMYGTGVEGQSAVLEAVKSDLAVGNIPELLDGIAPGQRIVPNVTEENIKYRYDLRNGMWQMVRKDNGNPIQFDIVNEDGSPAGQTNYIYIGKDTMTPSAEKLVGAEKEARVKQQAEAELAALEQTLAARKDAAGPIKSEEQVRKGPPSRLQIKTEAATADAAATSIEPANRKAAELHEIIDNTASYSDEKKDELKEKVNVAVTKAHKEQTFRGRGPNRPEAEVTNDPAKTPEENYPWLEELSPEEKAEWIEAIEAGEEPKKKPKFQGRGQGRKKN